MSHTGSGSIPSKLLLKITAALLMIPVVLLGARLVIVLLAVVVQCVVVVHCVIALPVSAASRGPSRRC